ncbi:MAG TPA: isoprenylcysteine carboxylmethyltransferase family protein [Terracidiphilus sp.]|nr:isoprenylcysteine carboxylmethyltransferase family protein [Terracidiphilus sp.]
MRASAIEFRLRMVIQIVIVFLGFWAPWVGPFDWARRISALEWLPLELSRIGLATFTVAAPVVIILGALAALLGAVLRVWGAAYLGYSTVHHGDMQAGAVMADGPYRYLRNPLYLGGWFMMLAISLIMTPSGALFTIVLIAIFYVRLVLGEEAFLAGKLGQPYQDYLRAVPRIVPRFRVAPPPAGNQPHWLTALFTEVMPIGTFVTFAVLAWFYDQQLMLEGIFWSFLASLVARGLMKAWIATLVSAAVFAGAYWPFHLNWMRSILIAFGAFLIVRALMPGKKSDAAEPKPDPA